MRIAAYVIPKSTIRPTGQAKHAINMLRCLARRPGVELVLLAARDQLTRDGNISTDSPLSGLCVRSIPLPAKALHFLWRTSGWPPVDRWCGRVDWIYSPTEMAVPSRRVRAAATIHCVNWFENDLPWSSTPDNLRVRRQMGKVFARILSKSRLVFTVSEFLKGRLCDLFKANPSKVVVVGNGVEDEFHAEGWRAAGPGALDRGPYVLSVGALESRKGAEHLLRFAQDLAVTAPHLRLVVAAGRFGNPGFIAQAERVPNMVLEGYTGVGELPALMRKAMALVILSRYETFGIPVVEAMATGTPVVAARFAALPEIVGTAGIVVDATQPQEVTRAVLSLADAGRREHYRQLGFQRVQQFQWRTCAATAHAAMREAMDNE